MDRALEYTDADHLAHYAASAIERFPRLRAEVIRLRLDPTFADDPLARLRLERALAGVGLGDLLAEDIPALAALPAADLESLIDAAAAHTARTPADGRFYLSLLSLRWGANRLSETLVWAGRRLSVGGVDDALLDEIAETINVAGAAIGWSPQVDRKRGGA